MLRFVERLRLCRRVLKAYEARPHFPEPLADSEGNREESGNSPSENTKRSKFANSLQEQE